MLHFFKLCFTLVSIDQKTILNWFRVEDLRVGISTDISLEIFRLILEGLWEKVQDGLTLADIENVLFFIICIRFIILAIRYNLKTSFYITCIGFFAGYLWYRHLIDLILMYRNVLLKLPFLHSLGMDAVQMRSLNKQMAVTDFKLGENAHWYNPGKMIYYAIKKGITYIDPETGLRYYVDPVSMIVANLREPYKSQVLPFYYKVYTIFLPKIFDIASKFWTQLSGVAAYAVITRIGKRYCPYLIRWHWTFLLMMGLIEQIFVYFIYRIYYFQTFILMPQTEGYGESVDPNIFFQINCLNILIATIVLLHIGFLIFGLLHATLGQYFYIPFFVENTELHIGPRPKNSIYSGGQTAWQEPAEKESTRFIPKIWFGWFGRGTIGKFKFLTQLKKSLRKLWKKFLRKLKKQFKK